MDPVTAAYQVARILVELGLLSTLTAFLSTRWADKYTAAIRAAHERELSHLNAQLGVKADVSKAQFEAEFAALSAIWEHVHEVRGRFLHACIPSGRFKDDEPDDKDARADWLLARVNTIVEPRNKLAAAVYKNEPFYPSELRDAFGLLINMIDLTMLQLPRDQWTSEWFDKNDERRRVFLEAVGGIEQMIRRRFSSLHLTNQGQVA